MQRLRRRALWVVLATSVVSVGIIVTTALPAIAVLTPAAITVLLALNSMTSKLTEHTCFGCGADIAEEPVSARGRMCPGCGAVNERIAMTFMKDAIRRGDEAEKRA